MGSSQRDCSFPGGTTHWSSWRHSRAGGRCAGRPETWLGGAVEGNRHTMTTIEKSIDVHVPVRTAYDQWTQFESFPEFMEGVERVVQVDDTLTHWVTKIGGVAREFDARIIVQQPD